MPIPRSTLDAIRECADLVGMFRAAGCTVKREGKRFKTCCLAHKDDTPSLSIDPERGTFLCYGCGWRGDAIDFTMTREHLAFPEAAYVLATRLGLEKLPGINERIGREPAGLPRSLEVLELAQQHFMQSLNSCAGGSEPARAYLAERGVSPEVAERYGLGFAPARWDELTRVLTQKGISEADLLEAGLVAERRRRQGKRRVYDVFRGRITFPFRDDYGRVVGFGARILPAFATRGRREPPKYINSCESPHFTKGTRLFGLYEGRPDIREQRTIVVEGYLDVLAFARIGISAVAPAGTAFTEDQARLLTQHGAERALFIFDGDEGGKRATPKAVTEALIAGITPYVVRLPEGTDPAEIVATEEADAVRELLRSRATSGIRYLASTAVVKPGKAPEEGRAVASGVCLEPGDVTETEDVLERARFLCDVIARVDDGLRRAALAREAAGALELPADTVHAQVEKASTLLRPATAEHHRGAAARNGASR